jgi:hypothetical protein
MSGPASLVKGSLGSIAAGETVIGIVGGSTTTVTVSPTVTAGAYHANDCIGGKLTLANAARVAAGSGLVYTLTVQDLAAQNAILEVYIFNADPTNGTYTDNGAVDINDTDMAMCIGRIDVAAADYKSLADNSMAFPTSMRAIPFKLASGTSLYAVVRTPGTPTYAATSDLKLVFGILQD